MQIWHFKLSCLLTVFLGPGNLVQVVFSEENVVLCLLLELREALMWALTRLFLCGLWWNSVQNLKSNAFCYIQVLFVIIPWFVNGIVKNAKKTILQLRCFIAFYGYYSYHTIECEPSLFYHTFSPFRMFRLRALSAVSVGLAQLSRCYHTGAVRGPGRRKLMLAALAGVTGVSASAGLLWKR